MDFPNEDEIDEADFTPMELLCVSVVQNVEFANLFYFISCINELQQEGLVEASYCSVLPESRDIFLQMKRLKYSLNDEELDSILNLNQNWRPEDKSKLKKFYLAYNSKKFESYMANGR